MFQLPKDRPLPRAEDLPDSDETPVDNELQSEIPGLLREVLRRIWAARDDWFLAVDMGLYYHPEYDRKLQEYQDFGILYYVIYNPLVEWRRYPGRSPFMVYRWPTEGYQEMPGNPVWLPELGLGIGYAEGTVGRWQRPWLYWYNEAGERYLPEEELQLQLARQTQREIWQRPTAELQAEQEAAPETQAEEQRRLAEAQVAQAEEQRRRAEAALNQLRDRLQALGIEPDQLQP